MKLCPKLKDLHDRAVAACEQFISAELEAGRTPSHTDGFSMVNFGPAHIVFEDFNLEDSFIHYCMNEAGESHPVYPFLQELLTIPEDDRETLFEDLEEFIAWAVESDLHTEPQRFIVRSVESNGSAIVERLWPPNGFTTEVVWTVVTKFNLRPGDVFEYFPLLVPKELLFDENGQPVSPYNITVVPLREHAPGQIRRVVTLEPNSPA